MKESRSQKKATEAEGPGSGPDPSLPPVGEIDEPTNLARLANNRPDAIDLAAGAGGALARAVSYALKAYASDESVRESTAWDAGPIVLAALCENSNVGDASHRPSFSD